MGEDGKVELWCWLVIRWGRGVSLSGFWPGPSACGDEGVGCCSCIQVRASRAGCM